MWFKQFIKKVCLLRLFNLTLIFPSSGCPLKRAWEYGLVAHPTLLQDPTKAVYPESQSWQRTLANVVKDRVFCRSITLQHIVYLFLLPLSARSKVYAIKIFNFGFLKCSCVASQGCVIPGVLHYSRVNWQPLNISTRTLQYMSSSDNIYAWLVSALM